MVLEGSEGRKIISNKNEPKQFKNGKQLTLETATNRPRSLYQYSSMAPRLSGQTSIFGVVFFVSKSPLGIERQKKKLINLQF